MINKARIMVVTPHPDDAEYGVAGTVARWTREGHDVIYVVCTNGDKGSDDPSMKPDDEKEIKLVLPSRNSEPYKNRAFQAYRVRQQQALHHYSNSYMNQYLKMP